MLKKVTEIAEQAVTNVSRRQFFGWLGRGAVASATVLGGFLAVSREASAGRKAPQLCLPASHQDCSAVGQRCGPGLRGTCVSVDRKDKSESVLCSCRIKGKNGPKRR